MCYKTSETLLGIETNLDKLSSITVEFATKPLKPF